MGGSAVSCDPSRWWLTDAVPVDGGGRKVDTSPMREGGLLGLLGMLGTLGGPVRLPIVVLFLARRIESLIPGRRVLGCGSSNSGIGC